MKNRKPNSKNIISILVSILVLMQAVNFCLPIYAADVLYPNPAFSTEGGIDDDSQIETGSDTEETIAEEQDEDSTSEPTEPDDSEDDEVLDEDEQSNVDEIDEDEALNVDETEEEIDLSDINQLGAVMFALDSIYAYSIYAGDVDEYNSDDAVFKTDDYIEAIEYLKTNNGFSEYTLLVSRDDVINLTSRGEMIISNPVIERLYFRGVKGTKPTITQGSNNDSRMRHIFFEGSGTLIVQDLVLDGNGNPGGISAYSGSNLEMKNVEVKNCDSETYGGAVFIGSASTGHDLRLKIENCTFYNNKASYNNDEGTKPGGGAIYFTNGKINTTDDIHVVIRDSIIDGNSTVLAGGGINIIDGNTVIENTIIRNNHADGANSDGKTGGGGIFMYHSDLQMDKCEVYNNTSVRGGGIQFYGNNTRNKDLLLEITRSEIYDNGAEDGGGIYAVSFGDRHKLDFNMEDTAIYKNTAETLGGGIYLAGSNLNTIDKVTIEENEAGTYGGGLCGLSKSTVDFAGTTTIYNNEANTGGGISLTGNSTMNAKDDTIIQKNEAIYGGGLYLSNSNLNTFDNAAIQSNKANQGGGMYLNGTTTINTKDDMLIDGNEANYGGGLFLSGTSTANTKDETKIQSNKAQYGGGLYLRETANFNGYDQTVVTDNTAEYDGGGIYTTYFTGFNSNDYSAVTATDYANISTESGTIFSGNTANGMYPAPDVASSYTHIGFASVSTDAAVSQHPVNNYDINYRYGKSYFKVTYDANDGSALPKTVVMVVEGETNHTVYNNTDSEIDMTRTGSSFKGWNTSAEGKGTTYKADDVIKIDKNINLYAQWDNGSVGKDKYNVTYNANGGAGSHRDTDLISNSTYTIKTLEQTGITHTGANFIGWNTSADGKGTSYRAGDIIKIEKNIELYAQWEKGSTGGGGGGDKDRYTVTYDANGGEGRYRDTDLRLGSIYSVKSLAQTGIKRDNATFLSWNTKADGSGTTYMPGNTFTIKNDVILYAQWELENIEEQYTDKGISYLNMEDHIAYIAGYPDKTVRPDIDITRAEVASIFFRLLTDTARDEFFTTGNGFKDLNEEQWYNNAVSTMANIGIIKGYEDNTFRGELSVTRAEFAAIASRFAQESGTQETGNFYFTDIAGHWAAKEIEQAAAYGWISGYEDGTFRPQQNITRAEVMTLVNNMLKRNNIKNLHPDMITWPDNLESDWYYYAVQEATNSHEYERDDSGAETWTEILPNPHWRQLESEWSANGNIN